jgi:NADH:ubiquinone oxidoreductase subunit 5 (subunit L)/multisubunit Na+/H+ antiporter MnhA subunit
MWVPYSALAVATVVIGFGALVGEVVPALNVEASLRSAASSYITALFPSKTFTAPSAPVDLPSSAVTGLFVALGFFAAFSFYITQRSSPSRFVGQSGLLRGLYTFLEKRWYINAVYYKVFVNAPIAASTWLSEKFDYRGLFRVNEAGSVLGVYLSEAGNWVDVNIVDGTANGFSSVGQSLSRAFRRIQTGIVEQYAQVFAIGVIVMIVFFLLALGVKLP